MNARADFCEPRFIVREVTALKVKWMAVGKAWQDNSPACVDCRFCREDRQAHPYGEGVAHENISECTLGERNEGPDLCPAINQTEQEAEHG